MTLGCGAFGGNITSDNISAHNLVLTKHVGYCYDGFVESFPDFSKGPPTELRFTAMPVSPAPSVASSAGNTSSSAVGTGSPVRAPRSPAPGRDAGHGRSAARARRQPHAPGLALLQARGRAGRRRRAPGRDGQRAALEGRPDPGAQAGQVPHLKPASPFIR
jgi:hypothetical protein